MGCRERMQHLSALRHDLQMAAVSGEASAWSPRKDTVTEEERQAETQIWTDREGWREMETG